MSDSNDSATAFFAMPFRMCSKAKSAVGDRPGMKYRRSESMFGEMTPDDQVKTGEHDQRRLFHSFRRERFECRGHCAQGK